MRERFRPLGQRQDRPEPGTRLLGLPERLGVRVGLVVDSRQPLELGRGTYQSMSSLDWVQSGLGWAGFVPMPGATPDAINAGISFARGDKVGGWINRAATVPFWGDGLKAGKMAAKNMFKEGAERTVKEAVEHTAKEVVERAPVRGGAGPVRVGQAGEAITTEMYRAKNTQSFLVNGRNRIPDHVLAQDINTRMPTSIVETKNVQYQAFTRQLRDYVDLVGPGGRVDVALPPGARVSGPLQRAFADPFNPLNRVDLIVP